MLRFYNINAENNEDIIISEEHLVMNKDIWKNGRRILRECQQFQGYNMVLIPIMNEAGELIAYGYHDNEANRELRMIRELRACKSALQFTDVFSEYKRVVIYGCNELAVSFAGYLKEIGVSVSVIGKYWNYFGYESDNAISLLEGGDNRLIIYAEGIPSSYRNEGQRLKMSVSPEFECINKIYEANVLNGRICDTIGDFNELINRLKGEQEIIILEADRVAQDAYDLLMSYGIDICGFAVKGKRNSMRLGRPIMSTVDAMKRFHHPVFLNCKDRNGALGEEWTEYFDYRGYERNKQFFLIKDYTDIPTSNLVHVLRNKRVFLTGDERLCRLLSDYLYQAENGNVTVKYVALSEKIEPDKEDILCLVIPDYYNRIKDVKAKREQLMQQLMQQLVDMGFVYYTKYFISSSSFAIICNYLNCDMEKYTISALMPKGILIGRIPAWSGNIFFHGIMDGHPEILIISYSEFNDNLFYYCIRLAASDSDEILSDFWELYNEEAGTKERFFPFPDIFDAAAKRLLSAKKRFTSQELFVLFHIAYAEMMSGRVIDDITKMVIYWEPHFVSRDDFPFFALWLEDKKINGQTIVLRRNNIVRNGSCCSRNMANRFLGVHSIMFLDESAWDGVKVQYHHWTEYKMRFEDIKINPKEKLLEICEKLSIAWSDNMLKTTKYGEPLAYRGSVDFDLKAVFNQYEDYLSEFDRFRISIASASYQKRYGFVYENCLKFSRRELQEMFFKPFLFEEKYMFEDDFLKVRERMGWWLWNVRKHMILDDVQPEFDRFEVE